MKLIAFFVLIFFLSCSSSTPQKPKNSINQNESLTKTTVNDSSSERTTKNISKIEKISEKIGDLEQAIINNGLVNIQDIDSTILVDLKYSSTDNFLKTDLYGDLNKCYLQPEVAKKLKLAQLLLRSNFPNYSLLLYDGVRPLSVQYKMWNALDMPVTQKTKYVSNPKNGSIHNYGAAVDLTIADENGLPLDMGTPYDYFGEEAYPRLEEKMLEEGKLSDKQIQNRYLLRNVMEKAGFHHITTEWWHFNSCSRATAKSIYSIVK